MTAQKRAQNLQDVPIAVTAVTQEALQVNRVTSVMDLNGLAPGLGARTNPGALGSPLFTLRGAFATTSQPGGDRQISTYIDGVYIGATRGTVFDLPDIQRIEVLRGPQGTLFGRNATAGAVSVVTRDPTGDFGVRQELTYGNYDQFRSRTSIDLPAMGPFSAYFTYMHDERRGDVRNLGAGTCFDRTSPFTNIGLTCSPKWLGSRNFENIFAAVKFEPTDSFTMVYKFDRSHGVSTPDARAAATLNPNSASGVGQMYLAAIAAQPPGGGRFGPVVLNPSNKRPKAINNAWDQEGYSRSHGHNLTMTWSPNDSISVKNITAYRRATVYGPATIYGVSGLEFNAATAAAYTRYLVAPAVVPGFASFPATTQNAIAASLANTIFGSQLGSYLAGYEGNSWGRSWQQSNETQVNYDSKLLTLTVGGVWYHSKEINSGLPGMRPNPQFAPLPTLLPLGNVQEVIAKSTSIAGYAQAEVHFTPQLDAVFGGRVTREKKFGTYTTGGTFIGSRTSGGITGALVQQWTYKKTKPTFSVGVNYRPSDDLLLYAKYSTGFLSGGAVGPFAFAPETVKSPEVGVKSEWFDHRLRVNVALWDATYHHTQSSNSGQNAGRPEIGTFVIDNGTLNAKGIEIETVVTPARGLTLSGQLSYTDAKLKNPNPVLITPPVTKYLRGGVPDWIGNLAAQYQTEPVYDDAYLFFRLDGNYQGKFRAVTDPDVETNNPAFAPYEFNPARWIINGRAALRDLKLGPANVEVGLWVRNLANNKDPAYPLAFGDINLNSSFQPARTYGVDLILSF